MDHLIERIEADIAFELQMVANELESQKYGAKYSEMPSYSTLKALVDCINILRSHVGDETLTVEKLLLEGI